MNEKILIVDDSAVSVEALKKVLRQERYAVFSSNDGKNIVELVEKSGVDVVLLDVVMPEISGHDLLKILQETETTKDIPVIMITELGSSLQVKKALEGGAMDFIRKSAEPIEIIARVNSAIKLKRKQDELIRNSQRDHLTKLYNKRFFNTTLDKLVKEKRNYHKGIGLILLDCDNFKRINDYYGHTCGDLVLSAVSNAIEKSLKARDFACRFGGEEFCVILPNATEFQGYAIAERIRMNIEKIPFAMQGDIVKITVSCGIGHTGSDDEKNGAQLVIEADIAMYKAKDNGRNQSVLFAEHMRENTILNNI